MTAASKPTASPTPLLQCNRRGCPQNSFLLRHRERRSQTEPSILWLASSSLFILAGCGDCLTHPDESFGIRCLSAGTTHHICLSASEQIVQPPSAPRFGSGFIPEIGERVQKIACMLRGITSVAVNDVAC